MKKKRRKIILWLLLLFLITRPYFYSRHFYIARGVPITLWDKKIIIGEWYWKFSEPTKNYLEVPAFDAVNIKFLDKKHFVILDFFGKEHKHSPTVVCNMEDYTCVDYLGGIVDYELYTEKYPLKNSLVEYTFEWELGRFYPTICYPRNDKIYEIDGLRVGYWVFKTFPISEETKQ